MKKFKIIISLILIIMLSGCSSVVSNIELNEDLTVTEKVIFEESTEDVGNDANSAKSNLRGVVKNYDKLLRQRNYSFDVEADSTAAKVNVYNNFSDLCTYFENTLFSKYLYNKIDCNETDEYIEIKNITEHIPYCSNCSDFPQLNNVTLNIKLPIDAISSNADSVSNNVYTWNYDEFTPNTKDIYLKISKNDLNEAKEKYQQKQEIKNGAKNIGKIIVIILIIAGILFLINVVYKKYKENKLKY